MLKSEKKLAELNKILINGKYNEINDRISILRSEEPFAGAVSLLADFYDKTKDEECFTVLETCSGMISSADKSGIISRLANKIDTYDTAKLKLARELIAVMKR